MKTVILVRVSSSKQETDRQVAELQQAAANNGWEVIDTIHERISGAATDREALNHVLTLARSGSIQKVLVHEVSRIARKNSTAHKFVEDLTEAGVSLYWHAQRIETLLPDGRTNPAASLMFALLAEMARSERETLIERTRSGIAEARRKGVTLGRPRGSRVPAATLLRTHADVASLLRAGKSIRDCAARTGKSQPTVIKVRRLMSI